MAFKDLRRQLVGFGAGLAAGVVMTLTALPHAAPARAQSAPVPDELAALKADVEQLKAKARDQSHVMADVAHHITRLWIGGVKENWPLADFFFSETQSHLRWAVRVIPVRKDAAGRDVDLRGILQGIETSSLKELHDAVAAKDKARFEKAYRQMTQSCASCHTASAKPYLRPKVPERPDTDVIEFAPQP
jgi:hypothetical protein